MKWLKDITKSERDFKIIKAYKNGETINKIAANFNVTPATVRKVIRDNPEAFSRQVY